MEEEGQREMEPERGVGVGSDIGVASERGLKTWRRMWEEQVFSRVVEELVIESRWNAQDAALGFFSPFTDN